MDRVSKNAAALKAYRLRKREGLAIVPCELNEAVLIKALQTRGLVQADQPIDRAAVARAASVVLEHWAQNQKG